MKKKKKDRAFEEVFLERYYQLSATCSVDTPINTNYHDLVNLLTMFKEAQEKQKRVSWVRRPTFQKLAEESKKMINDIYTIVMKPGSAECLFVKGKWRDKFKKDEDFWTAIREAIKKKQQGE